MGSIVFHVACVWMLCNILLSGAYKREYWKRHDKTIPEAVREDASGRWPNKTALDQITLISAVVLTIVSAYLNYFA
jgi:hypothetical protein